MLSLWTLRYYNLFRNNNLLKKIIYQKKKNWHSNNRNKEILIEILKKEKENLNFIIANEEELKSTIHQSYKFKSNEQFAIEKETMV